jgi:imidazolonepropionase-like amidohydrolase
MRMKKRFAFLWVVAVSLTMNLLSQDLALKGGTVLTITQGVIPDGTVLIQNGKISAFGKDITIPSGIPVIDCVGKFVMPGIIDSHTHIALGSGDINEATDPVTPQVWMKEALYPEDHTILTTLAGGVTTVKTMHGSANVIGGVNVTIKLKYNALPQEMIVKGARHQLKMALGENPKRFYGQQKGKMPMTRMGSAFLMRQAFIQAQEYKDRWDEYEKKKKAGEKDLWVPKKDLKMETLKLALEKKLSIDCHTYRADEIVWIINFCKEFGLDLLQLSHCVDGYKVADVMAEAGVTFGGWVDWWGFKEEAYDGCPYGFKIMYDAGVNIVINSDSADEGRHLFRNAAKVLKYNDIPEEDVLKMITLNPARSLELEDRIGSIEIGKDGDIAVFEKHPLDSTTKCLMTIIEGKIYFDYAKHSVTAGGGSHE